MKFLMLLLVLIARGDGLMFNLEPNNRKCLKEEIHKGVLVTGDYDISSHPGQVVDLMVIDTKGQHFVNYENTEKGKFAFTTDDYDVYEICFLSRVPGGMRAQRHEVFLQTKHGVEAKSYEGLADANKLKPLEIELKRLEDLSESIVQDFAHMRQREEEVCVFYMFPPIFRSPLDTYVVLLKILWDLILLKLLDEDVKLKSEIKGDGDGTSFNLRCVWL